VNDAEKLEFSSLHEYTADQRSDGICDFSENVSISPAQYRKFLADHAGYQRSLQILKARLMD
jgi:hypothetical protein